MSFNEAPASVTIKTRRSGFDVELTIRDETGEKLMPKLMQVIDWLDHNGFTPTATASGSPANSTSSAALAAGEVPMCPTHKCAMRPSKKPGAFYCPTKISDDDGTGRAAYCKQTAKVS